MTEKQQVKQKDIKTVSNTGRKTLVHKAFAYTLREAFHIGVWLGRDRIWQACLDKLYQLDQSVALAACHQHLEMNETLAPMRYFLTIANDLPPYRGGVLALVAIALRMPSSTVSTELETLVQSEVRQHIPERAAVAIASLVRLNSSFLLNLCETQHPYHIPAWRIALANETDLLFGFFYTRLLRHQTAFWEVVCELISQIARDSGQPISRIERKGMSQARTIVAKAVITGNAEVRQKAAYILAQAAPDDNWQILADLLVEQLDGKPTGFTGS